MDRPKITDKVRFWEEQDKINQALIPRVLEMQEHIKSANLLAQKNSSSYLNLSASLKDLGAKSHQIFEKTNSEISIITEKLTVQKNENSVSLNGIKDEMKAFSNELISLHSELEIIKKELANFDKGGNRKINPLSIIALFLSIIALVIAVLKG